MCNTVDEPDLQCTEDITEYSCATRAEETCHTVGSTCRNNGIIVNDPTDDMCIKELACVTKTDTTVLDLATTCDGDLPCENDEVCNQK
jgi:hypothetical protein